jgi:lipoprotein-releasing system ATP-binding protein
MEDRQPLVVVQNVGKRFVHEGRVVEVLRDVSLTIDKGEMVSIVGQSGAGKSTLLHILGTLDVPSTGRITYEGTDVGRLPSSRLTTFRNQTIGFVFQFHHLLPEFDALENAMMPGLIRGHTRKQIEHKAKALLEEVGLGKRLSHRPGELSGGEQQRVALARALLMEPKLVLADEPTGNLDSKTSDGIHELFFAMNQRHGTTFVVVTHSVELAKRMPRVVTMRDGRVESDDTRNVAAPARATAQEADDAPLAASTDA